MKKDIFKIENIKLKSRLIVGTGKYKIFKESAKAVKESAIANAKAALEESFTPHLKTMLSHKLQEMEEDVLSNYFKILWKIVT